MKLPLLSERGSLSRRLVFTVIIVSSITTFMLTGLQIGFEFQRRIRQVENRFTQVEYSYVANIQEHLWTYSMNQIALQIDGLTRLPEIDYISIINKDKLLIESGTKPANTSLRRSFELKRLFNNEKINIGWITIYANIEAIYTASLKRAAVTLVSNGIKTFIVAFVCILIFQRLVNRPLSQIGIFLRNLRIDDPPALLKINRPKEKFKWGPDEFDDVENAVNSMIDHIQLDKKRKEILEYELAQQREQHQSSDRINIASEISASIGHEIKQPLFAITGYSSVCQNQLGKPDFDKAIILQTLQKIGKESTRANNIISNMKQLFEKDHENHQIKDVCPILTSTINMFESMLGRENIRLSLNIAEGPYMISCNEIHIQQLFSNILQNAIQALRSKGEQHEARIEIGVTRKAQTVEIIFADNGPGISKDNVETIFEAFYTSKPSGTGMGLSISRNIALYHDGKLDVFNNNQGGASFSFSLPLISS